MPDSTIMMARPPPLALCQGSSEFLVVLIIPQDHPLLHAADRAMTCVIRRCLGRGHDAVLSVQ